MDLASVTMKIGREHFTRLSGIRANAPLSPHVRGHAQAMVDHHRATEIHSRLVDISHQLVSRKPMESLEAILAQLGELLTQTNCENATLKTTTISEALGKSLAEVEKRIVDAQAGKTAGIPSGLPTLDMCIHGFRPGFVYILGARTGKGKTTMATTMAVNAAMAGHKVAFVTVEMSDVDIADKMMTRLARVTAGKYLSGDMAEDETDRIMQAARTLNPLPIVVTDVSRPNFVALAFEMMRLVRVEGVKFIVIDYLQLFEVGDGKWRQAREEAKTVSARLKELAKSLQIPILVLSQLNRESPEIGIPDLRHIAESDQIARDADVVMFLYLSEQRDYWLNISKHRRGKTGQVPLVAHLDFGYFAEATNG